MRASRLEVGEGVELAVAEWPGDLERSVLAIHATGLCKEVWAPVAQELSRRGVRFVAIDQRGHGESSSLPATADWWGLGSDAAAVASELGPFALGLGHSSGATAATMIDLLRPGLLPRLVVIEPVVFPTGGGYDTSLAEGARRRRASFSSMAEAREHFEGRGIFAGWHEAAFSGYLSGGTRSANGGLELACPPEVEAQFYERGMSHGVWERLGELTVPVRLLIGERSTFNVGTFARDQARAFGAELTMVAKADHFLPMQRPEVVTAAVIEALEA